VCCGRRNPSHIAGLGTDNYPAAYNSNKMHNSQSLFLSDTALHVSGVVTTHPQEHKATASTASGNRYTALLSAVIVEELERV